MAFLNLLGKDVCIVQDNAIRPCYSESENSAPVRVRRTRSSMRPSKTKAPLAMNRWESSPPTLPRLKLSPLKPRRWQSNDAVVVDKDTVALPPKMPVRSM